VTPAQKLYVGNLRFSVTEDDLTQFVAEFGFGVKLTEIIKDRDTGQSRGFGFVTLEIESDNQEACETLDGRRFKGRELRVNLAKPQTPRKA
jgi:RNA recognition motif-containing protein